MKTTKNIAKRNGKNGRREEGVALLIAILTLLLVTAIAAGIVLMTNTETSTSSNFTDEQRAYFSAKAGFEEVRDRMDTASSATIAANLPTSALPGDTTAIPGILYVTNPLNSEADYPWNQNGPYSDDEICKESTHTAISCTTVNSKSVPSGSSSTCPSWCKSVSASTTYQPSSGAALDWKWVRVQVKENNAFGNGYYVNGSTTTNPSGYTCWNSTTGNETISASACVSPNYPVYVLTTLAVTPSGSRRMVQAEVAANITTITAPAALTVDGNTPSFDGGTSSQFGVSGVDVGGCGSTTKGASVPAVGVIENSDITLVDTGIPNKTAPNYSGSGSSSPDVENVSAGLITEGLSTVTQLQNLVSTLKANITQPVVPGGSKSLSNAGSLGAPQTIFVNGDLTLSGNTVGYGVLVVTGTLTLKGTVQWNGLIVVVGQGDMQMDGTNTVNGAVLIGKTLDSSGNLLSSLGLPIYGVNGGGNAFGGVYYSGNCLQQAAQPSTFHTVAVRELMN